ncbi:uncharacterized protein K452DRAFT_307725 [Aplosporella prunicola CBS 121167]|uniref:DUF7580 domain-containing protein n=1 Tax=Aplosporella prunicola CBS 121167 TaxID=1176127 RepID=A0A6A6BGT5_9PEZI|nr:uncharacterized protein K452DRAFT_307725 [Aplosporella prunicola CBS 121167]KAF2142808.1 hypothetical protein K452DRAFT_307725 [Aplosporella prunicola CBS 121167]
MSGVELAGLVLAVLPLVIQALEDYNEGLDPIKAFIRWERELPSFIRKLRNQHVQYELTLRLLLTPITTEYELAEMITDPSGDLWKDPEMAIKLEEKLGEAYQAYQGTMTDIDAIMKKIASKLDLNRDPTVLKIKRNDLEAMLAANPRSKTGQRFEFTKRAKFSMNKKKIKSLLDELDECNKELERFTEKSEKLEPYRRASKPSLAQKIQKIQSYARTLHYTLLEAFSCSCRDSHCTNLQLEQRELGLKSGVRKTKGEPETFTISFTDKSLPFVWQEARICFSEEIKDISAGFGELNLSPRFGRSVSFLTPPPTPQSLHRRSSSGDSTSEKKEVRDLCSTFRTFEASEKAYISFSFEKGRLWGGQPVPPTSLKPFRSAEAVTLEDLLNGVAKSRLSKKERYTLAVTLASSILQLHASPWIGDHWSKRDIIFYRTISNTPRTIDIERPHVTQKLKPNPIQSNGKAFMNKNTTLLALGVLLLELYFGQSYEDQLGVSFDEQMNTSMAVWANAYEWYQTEQEDLSAAFQGAIAHCFRCFGDPSASLQDPLFLQAAIEQIVLPLQDELGQFLGRSFD